MVGLLLFGLHLLALGYLTYRSGQVPRLLGVLLAVVGLGYAFDTMAAVVVEHFPFTVSTIAFLGEFLLAQLRRRAQWQAARAGPVTCQVPR